MAAIDFGVVQQIAKGTGELDEIIASPVPLLKRDGTPGRLKFDGDEHILTIGPTRSGKGRRLLCPELVYDTDRSIVVVDPKGELAKWTATHREGRTGKGTVFALDPFGVLPKLGLDLPSVGYNPMKALTPPILLPSGEVQQSDDFTDDATALAEAICPVENKNEPHWEANAQDIIAGLVMYHRIVDPDAGLATIRKEFGRTPAGWKDLMVGDDKGMTTDGKRCVLLVAQMYECDALLVKLGMLEDVTPDNREIMSVLSTCRTKTRFLDSPPIARDLAKPGIDFSELKNETVTVYLVLPPVRLVTHAKWLRLVISGAIEALRKSERNRARPDTLFILDEFPQLGRMQGVETGIQLNAGYGIKFWVVVQNITQLKDHYPNTWETFASAGVLTSYAPRDPTTSQYLRDLSGERTIDVAGESRDVRGGGSVSINRQRRENVMPHQFRQMRKGMMFVRLPDADHGERLYITEAADFTERGDIPKEVKALG
jgi:type IV secretion system protein VirD4